MVYSVLFCSGRDRNVIDGRLFYFSLGHVLFFLFGFQMSKCSCSSFNVAIYANANQRVQLKLTRDIFANGHQRAE
jgi:hypothetical protein